MKCNPGLEMQLPSTLTQYHPLSCECLPVLSTIIWT